MPSKIPPTRQAPIIAPYAITPPPHAATVLFNTPRKPEEVPITIGTFPPTDPMENICTNVTIPAIIMAFCKRAVLSSAKPASAVSPHAPHNYDKRCKVSDEHSHNMLQSKRNSLRQRYSALKLVR